MLIRSFSLISLLMSILLISGCDKDPLSQKGKIFLDDSKEIQNDAAVAEISQPANDFPQPDGNVFQYSTAAYKTGGSQNDEVNYVIKKVANTAVTSSEVIKIDWDALIPNSHRPDSKLIEQYNNGEIDAEDPRIIALKELMRELLELAPVNKELAGRMIKLPGFALPIEHDGDKVTEFLLLPYHGACLHVPAPPANQIVYVRIPGGTTAASKVYDTVWVTGRLSIEHIENDMAESGYVMDAVEVVPFE